MDIFLKYKKYMILRIIIDLIHGLKFFVKNIKYLDF